MAQKGRPRNVRPHEIKLALPKVPLQYMAKRQYWALLEVEKKMAKDITSVKMSEYMVILGAFIDTVDKLKKIGITHGYKARSGVDTRKVGETRYNPAKAGVGENESSELGAGVPTSNPLA